MKTLALLPLLSALAAVQALPSGGWNWAAPLTDTADLAGQAIVKANDWLFGSHDSVDAQNVVMNGMECESLSGQGRYYMQRNVMWSGGRTRSMQLSRCSERSGWHSGRSVPTRRVIAVLL
jgi:hypothetical protein